MFGSNNRLRGVAKIVVSGATRSWTKIEDFTREVSNARIFDGVHYRNSTEVGAAMGKQIGDLAAAKFLRRE